MAVRRAASGGRKRASSAPSGRGGARHGAGRKRDIVPPEVMARVGPLPPETKPLQVARWWQRMLGELAILRATTGRYSEVQRDMCNLSTAQMRAMPLDAIREALVLLDLDEKRLKESNTGPKERDAGESSSRAIRRSNP